MTGSEIKTIIRDKFAADLPALLATAGLNDFEDYLPSQPGDYERRQLGMYTENRLDVTTDESFSLIIQAQLANTGDFKQEYDDVLFPYIKKNITAELCGFTVRDSLEADLYPVDSNSTSFYFYILTFSNQLDDCYEDA